MDVELSVVKAFYDKFDALYQAVIHDGEKETLAFLDSASEEWLVCAGDKAVFRVLGLLGKAEQGISLEEVLEQIGLGRQLDWPFSKRFRNKFTSSGQTDAIQGGGTN